MTILSGRPLLEEDRSLSVRPFAAGFMNNDSLVIPFCAGDNFMLVVLDFFVDFY